jgi:ketosteroid isomerase-like protein
MTSSRDSDLRAIEALNQRDINAVMASDLAAIASQWTDDFVILPSAGPIVRGRAANAEIAERGKQQIEAMEPLDYRVDFDEIEIVDERRSACRLDSRRIACLLAHSPQRITATRTRARPC